MKFKYLLILLVAYLYACNNDSPGKENNIENEDSLSGTDQSDTGLRHNKKDTLLITDTSFAGITAADNYASLQSLFGKNNLKEELMYGAEGMDSFMVTKIFSGTPKEIIVYWSEGKQPKKITSVETHSETSPYITTEGLKIGSTLQQLLSANGKPVNFYGTSWDYGGTIISYNKGKFEKSNIRFQLNGKEDMDEKLMGDQELNTNMPLVKQNLTKIYIDKIFVLFEK